MKLEAAKRKQMRAVSSEGQGSQGSWPAQEAGESMRLGVRGIEAWLRNLATGRQSDSETQESEEDRALGLAYLG